MTIQSATIQGPVATLSVLSTAFKPGEHIPSKYSCDGKNVNPPLHIENIPQKTKSLVLIMDDPDAPAGTWVHWIVWNIKPQKEIRENSMPGTEGLNSFKMKAYGGPCPPSGIHHYFFKLYALNDVLDLNPNTTKTDLEKAMQSHVIGYGELMGTYSRK